MIVLKPWWYNPSSEHYYDLDEVMLWKHYEQRLLWRGFWVVAERYLPDGTRQYLVRGTVPDGVIINNADIIGEQNAN